MDSLDASSFLPLVGASVLLLGLVAIVLFAFVKMKNASGKLAAPSSRLSEEAFAAAMIRSATSGRPAPPAGSVGAAGAVASPDAADVGLIDALPIAIVGTDEAGVVRRLNAAARAELGLGIAATGHPFRSVLAPWPELVEAIARAQTADAAVAVDVGGLGSGPGHARAVRWGPNGRGVVVAITASAARGDAAAAAAPVVATGAASSHDEATPLRSAEVAEDVSKLASGLAHELANSLTTIHGYAHLINASGLSEQDRAAIDQIRLSGEGMLHTIESFRALVRPLRPMPEPFPADHAVEDAIRLACQDAKASADTVQLTAVECGPVLGDRVLIEEAIAAVVQNAIEAHAELTTPPPAPVSVRLAPAVGGGADVVIADCGPGVLPELRKRMGQPFLSDKVGHAGLGLARAFHLLRAHAGVSIELDHPVSGGLVVTIHLPPAA